MIKSYSDLML